MSPSPTCVPTSAWPPGTSAAANVRSTPRQRRAREVEQRPPAEHTAERSGREVELGRRGDGEPQVRVLPAGVRDHPRRQVDARSVKAEPGEVRGDGARAAADVEDRPESPRTDSANAPSTARSQGSSSSRPVAELHVGVGDAVVGLANRLEVGGLLHGRHPTQAARECRPRRASGPRRGRAGRPRARPPRRRGPRPAGRVARP